MRRCPAWATTRCCGWSRCSAGWTAASRRSTATRPASPRSRRCWARRGRCFALQLARVRAAEPRLADLLEPMMGVTLAPTMIRASEKENVIPSRCTVRVDCRVPPGMGEEHVRRRVTELLGARRRRLHARVQRAGGRKQLAGGLDRLPDFIRDFVERTEPGAGMLPLVLPGFTDSHWFRKAFPECVAYGFFPQRAMTRFDTMPLIHAPDERIARRGHRARIAVLQRACTGRTWLTTRRLTRKCETVCLPVGLALPSDV